MALGSAGIQARLIVVTLPDHHSVSWAARHIWRRLEVSAKPPKKLIAWLMCKSLEGYRRIIEAQTRTILDAVSVLDKDSVVFMAIGLPHELKAMAVECQSRAGDCN